MRAQYLWPLSQTPSALASLPSAHVRRYASSADHPAGCRGRCLSLGRRARGLDHVRLCARPWPHQIRAGAVRFPHLETHGLSQLGASQFPSRQEAALGTSIEEGCEAILSRPGRVLQLAGPAAPRAVHAAARPAAAANAAAAGSRTLEVAAWMALHGLEKAADLAPKIPAPLHGG